MPSYTYKCSNESCGVKTERLVQLLNRDNQKCLMCGKPATRQEVNTFAVNTPLDTTKKDAYTKPEIDRIVGESANTKWNEFHEKLAKKIEGQTLVDVVVKPGEKFNSEALIGDKSRQELSLKAAASVQAERQTAISQGKNPDSWDKTGFNRVSI